MSKEIKISLFKLIKTYGFFDTIEALFFWNEKKETDASREIRKALEENWKEEEYK